jgi:hypothetical protein
MPARICVTTQAFDDSSCHRKPKTDRRIERDRPLAGHDETRMPDVAAAVRVIVALALKAASREAVCRLQPQQGGAPLQPC